MTDFETSPHFSDKDRIAMPAVKVSIQAVTLQMAAEQEFGQGQHGRLDHLTVSMSHPDATAALLSGRSEVTGRLAESRLRLCVLFLFACAELYPGGE